MMTNQEARPDGDPEKSLSEKPEAPASLPPQLQPGRDQKHGADEKALGGADAVSPAENDRGGDNDVDAEAAKPERVQSARPSMRAPTYVVVPRSQRRGLLARLTILPEIDRPYEYPDSTKWCITTFTAIAACIAPMGSAIFYRKPSFPGLLIPSHVPALTCYPSPCSGAAVHARRTRHDRDHRKLDSGFLHAGYGDWSAVVVVLL